MKTLIGKNGYLFLQNDSAKELAVHFENLCLVNDTFYKKYETVKDKYLLTIFPDKSYLYSDFLPEKHSVKYRPAMEKYVNYLQDHVLDGYPVLKDIDDTFYKTDTHINNKGALLIYHEFVNKINTLFGLSISSKQYELTKLETTSLCILGYGIGDLTWEANLGPQQLETTKDTFYKIKDHEQLYIKSFIHDMKTLKYLNNTLEDKTIDNIGANIGWNLIGDFILYKKNDACKNKLKILIFYDSFLCSTLHLYVDLFYEVYSWKCTFHKELVELINPDFVFEFRVERFLF